MTNAQRELLYRLVGEYVNNMDDESAARWMDRIENTAPNQVYFAWAGMLL